MLRLLSEVGMILVLGVAERRMIFKRLERKKERNCCGGQLLLGVICVYLSKINRIVNIL